MPPEPAAGPVGPMAADFVLPGDAGPGSAQEFDVARFRDVLGHFGTGVTVITGMAKDVPVGFTAQSFTSVSLDPALVAVCPARSSVSWPVIRHGGTFCANVLAEDQESLGRVFATRGADKFKGVPWKPSPATASPILDGVLAWVDCRIVAEHDGGDHVIAVARVV
ncbi:MAG TPA: flavin reductase family protein, partial [Acidimicrobiales bacterium]|nr:flavin reductase family protein [Acidimicrobiales bacterium]